MSTTNNMATAESDVESSRLAGPSFPTSSVQQQASTAALVKVSPYSSQLKSTSSVRDWSTDPLRERKRLTREEAVARSKELQSSSADEDAFGGRLLEADKDPWSYNAWDHVEPPPEYLAMAEDKIKAQAQTRLSDSEAERYNSTPANYWDSFYSRHENRFFKDRRWLHLEFPELIQASRAGAPPTRIIEVGCGAGNTVFPLLERNENPGLEIFACDYSAEAVAVVKSNPLYVSPRCGKCHANVWDLSSSQPDAMGKGHAANLPAGVEPHSLDIVVLIFVLSALHPNEWAQAICNVRSMLKPGGLVLVRDYGRHDLPQLRFGKGRLMADNLYIRGDGTRVYFFTPEDFLSIFNATPQDAHDDASDVHPPGKLRHDFVTLQLAIDRRMLLNRKEKKQMFRNWLQAKFRLLPRKDGVL